MKVALLGNYPLVDLLSRASFYSKRSHVITSWNVNLLSGLARLGTGEFHLRTLAPCWRTQVIDLNPGCIHLLETPPRFG